MALRNSNIRLCASLECVSAEEMAASMEKAKAEGADIVELCLDSITTTSPLADEKLERLLKQRTLPSIASFRLNSSRNKRLGCKATCLHLLKKALELDVEFVEMDYEVAKDANMVKFMSGHSKSKIIVSTYLYGEKPSMEKLGGLVALIQSTGADILKLEIAVDCITNLAPIFNLLSHSQVPLIVVAVGSRGLISQLLGPKFGAFLAYGSLKGKPVPGLPTLASLRQVYKLEYLNPETKVFGLISNPVSHSKGPLLHNPTFRHTGFNGIYVPMQVDDIKKFFKTYQSPDLAGFSVGIPHKEAAVTCCDEVHPLAKSIGAVNTIIRRPLDGKLIGYNTDCDASISAIEDALIRERTVSGNGATEASSPLRGKIFVLVGAGGAGRALAFGAKDRGARVFIFNRSYERAKALANAVSGEALPFEYIENFCPEKGMILANASAIGMELNSHQTPVPKEALRAYELVFDAVYTPKNTRLLKEAAEVGAIVVSGVEMFLRQALGQFKLFTGGLAPECFMRKLVLEQF